MRLWLLAFGSAHNLGVVKQSPIPCQWSLLRILSLLPSASFPFMCALVYMHVLSLSQSINQSINPQVWQEFIKSENTHALFSGLWEIIIFWEKNYAHVSRTWECSYSWTELLEYNIYENSLCMKMLITGLFTVIKKEYNAKLQQDDLLKLLYSYILVYNRFIKQNLTKGL